MRSTCLFPYEGVTESGSLWFLVDQRIPNDVVFININTNSDFQKPHIMSNITAASDKNSQLK